MNTIVSAPWRDCKLENERKENNRIWHFTRRHLGVVFKSFLSLGMAKHMREMKRLIKSTAALPKMLSL
jgi:hypothetical protein